LKTLLLAAGLGSRLRPITNDSPKCLVPINGKPLLQIWLERLSKAGFGPFLINTHYLSEKVEEFVLNSEFKDCVTLVHEKSLLGTAGTLIQNVDFFDGDGLVLHADNLCYANLVDFRLQHENRPQGCHASMMTFITEDPSSCGIVKLDQSKVVVEFHEKSVANNGNLANAAIYIFSKEILSKIRHMELNDISLDLLPMMLGSIYSIETDSLMIDVGTIENYRKAIELTSKETNDL